MPAVPCLNSLAADQEYFRPESGDSDAEQYAEAIGDVIPTDPYYRAKWFEMHDDRITEWLESLA